MAIAHSRIAEGQVGTTAIAAARDWLSRFGSLATGQSDASGLFTADCAWRDGLAVTWDIRTYTGDAVPAVLAERLPGVQLCAIALSLEPAPAFKPRGGRTVLEAFFDFRTRYGRGRGVVRLIPGDGSSARPDEPTACDRAWTLLTTLQELDGFEEKTGPRRPRTGEYARNFGAPNWRERIEAAQSYDGRDPQVLIVGGGHAGMTLAARLGQMSVDTLVVDSHERAGDNWRKRYSALTLHNEAWVCDLPWMPYPPTWPVYLPKDMLADWLESYSWAMELKYWTSTTLVSAEFDDVSKRWTARLRRAGVEHVLHPAHLVIATGMSGEPRVPGLPGLGDFAGETLHTHSYVNGERWKGRNAVIVGSSTSAHDVAQDLHGWGAQVTMIQRSPTTIVSVEPAAQLVFALYSEGPSREDCDLLSMSMTYDLMLKGQTLLTQKMLELDKELIAALEARGFRTDIGEDGSGYYMKYLRTGGGYYLDVGCSSLIADGSIAVRQNANVETFVADGVAMTDGSRIPADLVVLATGYTNMQDTLRRLLGDAVAEKVGPIWGFDDHGDMRNVWKRTAQENLWIMAGSFAQCRTYSRYVALQIKAIEEGVIPSARESCA